MSQMNLNYRQRKQAKTITLAKHNDAYMLILRRFDPDTGQEIMPEQVAVDLAQFEKRRAALLDEIAQIDEIVADLRATKRSFGEIIAGTSGAERAD